MTSRMRAFMEESISAPIRMQARCWGPALAITSTITSSGRSMVGIVTTDNRHFPSGHESIVIQRKELCSSRAAMNGRSEDQCC
jgi:hypothetical protein